MKMERLFFIIYEMHCVSYSRVIHSMRDSLIFFGVVFFAIVGYFVVYHFTLASADEGYYALDALKWGRFGIPIADYSSRAPMLLWLIRVSVGMFGPSLFTFRLPIILISSASAGFLFLLGSRLFSRKVGVVAGLLYAANPYILWNGQQIKTETLLILFVIVSALFLVEGFKKKRWYFFILSGACMGLGYVERHSAVAFMAAGGLAILYNAYQENTKVFFTILKNGVLLFVGVALGFAPLFIWVASHNVARAVDFWFGIAADILRLQGVHYLTPNPLASQSGLLSAEMVRAWSLAFIEKIAAQAWFLLAGFIVFLASIVQLYFPNKRMLGRIVAVCSVLIVSSALFFHSGLIFVRGTFRPYVFLFMTIFTSLFVYVFLRFAVFKEQFQARLWIYKNEISLIVFWITTLIAAYSFWTPGYIRELIPPLTLATALLVVLFPWRDAPKLFAAIGVFSIVGLYTTSLAWYHSPLTGGWSWTRESVDNASLFFAGHTKLDEPVLTANPLPVLIARRRVFLDIYAPDIPLAPGFDQRFGTSPTPHEFYTALAANPPKYAVVDSRMKNYFYKPYPVIEEFVVSHYSLVKTFGEGSEEIQIWEKMSSL